MRLCLLAVTLAVLTGCSGAAKSTHSGNAEELGSAGCEALRSMASPYDLSKLRQQGIEAPIMPSKRVEPVYPPKLMAARIEGEVKADMIVDHRGRVRHVEIIEGGDTLFAKATKEAVRRWRYTPLTCENEPIEYLIHLTMEFKIRR